MRVEKDGAHFDALPSDFLLGAYCFDVCQYTPTTTVTATAATTSGAKRVVGSTSHDTPATATVAPTVAAVLALDMAVQQARWTSVGASRLVLQWAG